MNDMERQYTREQIVKAIKHWSRILQRMDETNADKRASTVVDALIAEFGEDRVKPAKTDYKLNDHDLDKIFTILNANLFENRLKKPILKYIPEQNVVNRLNDALLCSEAFDKSYSESNCYGVYIATANDTRDKHGKTNGVHLTDDSIIMNSSYLTSCMFIFAVASVCHEMIHYYERCLPGFEDLYFKQSTGLEKVCDPHDTETFEKKMAEANAAGIGVVKQYPDKSNFVERNLNAHYKLETILGEEQDSTTAVYESGGMVIVRAKGSSKSALFNFD